MNNIVESKRIQYTASGFAKQSLLYLQEVGFSKSIKQHTSLRHFMSSYLFFIVLEGNGSVIYDNKTHILKKGDCVFLDCHNTYSHSSDNWEIAWVHFYSDYMKSIYDKYIERNGKNIFVPKSDIAYINLINEIYNCADSNDHIKDMTIYNKLSELIYTIMSETVYSDSVKRSLYDPDKIKEYLDSNYTDDISLDDISKHFYINKFYLTRLFKDKYGITINNYINEKRITKSKELLRFSDMNIENIGNAVGISDANYFSRLFKKIEGITPKQYKQMWNV